MSVPLQIDDSRILQVSFECGRLKVVVADSLDSNANFNIFAKFKKNIYRIVHQYNLLNAILIKKSKLIYIT